LGSSGTEGAAAGDLVEGPLNDEAMDPAAPAIIPLIESRRLLSKAFVTRAPMEPATAALASALPAPLPPIPAS